MMSLRRRDEDRDKEAVTSKHSVRHGGENPSAEAYFTHNTAAYATAAA